MNFDRLAICPLPDVRRPFYMDRVHGSKAAGVVAACFARSDLRDFPRIPPNKWRLDNSRDVLCLRSFSFHRSLFVLGESCAPGCASARAFGPLLSAANARASATAAVLSAVHRLRRPCSRQSKDFQQSTHTMRPCFGLPHGQPVARERRAEQDVVANSGGVVSTFSSPSL